MFCRVPERVQGTVFSWWLQMSTALTLLSSYKISAIVFILELTVCQESTVELVVNIIDLGVVNTCDVSTQHK